jgi:hypothetical protein
MVVPPYQHLWRKIMSIVFKVRDNNGNSVSSPDKKEAVREFLQKFKSRSFTISEFRGGCFTRSVFGTNPDDCFYKSFASRAEAKQFCEEV